MSGPYRTAGRARAREEIPTAAEMVALALDIHDAALEKTHCASNGEEYPQPELNSATKALELAARLAGYLGDGKTVSKEQFEKLCNDAGFDLVPRAKKLRSVK